MPLVEVTYAAHVSEPVLRKLAAGLPHAVSVAVQCPEEPYDHELEPGDVEVRFRRNSPFDVAGLDVVIEVRSKWTHSREVDRQRRCTLLHKLISDAVPGHDIGVYLTLPVAAWDQS